MYPRIGASRCFPLPSSGYRGRPSQGPAVPHLRGYYGVVRPLRHPSTVTSGLPWWPVPPLRRWEALLGSWRIPFGSMPRARDSGGPVRPHPTGRPGTAFRSHNSVGVRHGFDFGAESSRPASLLCTLRTHRSPGEWQHWLPACWLALAGRDSHPLDSTKRFHWLISAPPLPSFSQRDMRVNSKCAHQVRPPLRPDGEELPRREGRLATTPRRTFI
jgi:hypothetical protein